MKENLPAHDDDLLNEAAAGLSAAPKRIPPKLFYDERGSALFEMICELDEYYLTRTEMKIMQDNIKEIVTCLGEQILLVEFGSGSSLKTRLLLNHLKNISGYIPIDISSTHLIASVKQLKDEYPQLKIYPLAADFTLPFQLPETDNDFSRITAYYPGSSIGNFTPGEAKILLKRIARLVGAGGGLLIGIDMVKKKKILEAAYNDSKGITAEFNLNILKRLNEQFSSDFKLSAFKHYAFFNDNESRIEMHLVSLEDQDVHLNNAVIHFNKDEHIITEYSYKYSPERFAEIASGSFEIKETWMDEDQYFSVQYLAGNLQANS